MNFYCVFPSCNFKGNVIDEKEFRNHLNEKHLTEMLSISKKEDIHINFVEIMTVSNSKVFINP